ncbi:MAG: DPP IV N-terminal domain-containing protein [Pirellulales bacterium]
MNLRLFWIVLFAGLTSVAGFTMQQTAQLADADDARADVHPVAVQATNEEFLRQYAETYRFSLGRPRSATVTPDGSAVLFLRSQPRSFVQNLYEFDCRTRKERVLLTAEQVLGGGEETLSEEEKARRERQRLAARGIASFDLSKDGSKILVPLSGKLFVVERTSGKSREIKSSSSAFPIDPTFSPDASLLACVRDGEVFVTDLESGSERKITRGAGGAISNGTAEFVAQEEMSRHHGYWWSPDNKLFAYQQTDTVGVETFHIADPAKPESEPSEWPYPRPGKKNADVKLGIVPVAGGDTVWVTWDREKYPYLATVTWEENAPLTIVVQSRQQTDEIVYSVDHKTGATTELLNEYDIAWINLQQSCPCWLKDGSGFLWLTERSGEWSLELRSRDGKQVRTITPSGLGLLDLAGLDDDRGIVYFGAASDPTQVHLYSVPLAGGKPQRLTTEPGMHGYSFGEKADVYLHGYSLADGRTGLRVERSGGESIGELKSVAEEPPFLPTVELVTVGDDNFRGVIVRPRSFDRSKSYPVVVEVYGGPQANTVNAASRGYLLDQWLADQGFIVVSIDGRGTPRRSREWERTIKGNLIDVPLEDQVRGLKSLGKKFPEMDLSRVGIGGWSFGGYFSAMAVMRRPDVYKAGVAGAPVCSWEDYDTHYTERYLGLPAANQFGYESSNVLTYCKDLSVPLLIVHGTSDDNVYFMHSLKMTEALFRAGKEFEFLPLAGFTHMVPDPEVTVRLHSRIAAFFKQHLGEPR